MSEAVILMAYGSPERLVDVPAYYADIRGGRPIAPENLADLVERYRRLGIEDSSPLNAITEQTRAALEEELGLPVYTGMKHWSPRIADAAEAALAAGAARVAGVVLAPHYSALSIKGYRDQLEQALAGRAELAFVESWHDEPGFVDLLAERVRGTQSHVVFSAHSLPLELLLPERVAYGRAVARSRHPRPPGRAAWRRRHRRAHLPGGLRLRPSRDPVGHRRRGAGQGVRARHAGRSH
jgi:ferrochelatase